MDCELFETRKENSKDTAARLANDEASVEVDYYVTESERSSVKEDERSSGKRNAMTSPRMKKGRDRPLNESPSGSENEEDVTNE